MEEVSIDIAARWLADGGERDRHHGIVGARFIERHLVDVARLFLKCLRLTQALRP